MSAYRVTDRQLQLVMMHLSEEWPGLVCLDWTCPSGEVIPHMANDGGPHPHPYGLKPPLSATARRKWRQGMKRLRLGR